MLRHHGSDTGATRRKILEVKRAIISDIHANLEALTAVLARIDDIGVDSITCLGDVIGYGPDPVVCLDTVIERCSLVILGNHDQAAIFDPEGFNPVAMKAILWTRDQLEKDSDMDRADQRWDYLGGLPRRHDEGNLLFVHGSPRDPTNEYVFEEHIYQTAMMDMLFSRFDHVCFQGHTHLPGVFTEERKFLSPGALPEGVYQITDDKCMVNVGSVGQPRDDNRDSCFVVLDSDANTIEYHRVRYPAEVTREKIYAIPELENMLGDRLMSGR